MNTVTAPSWLVFDFYGVIVVDAMREIAVRHNQPAVYAEVSDLSHRFDLGEIELDFYIKQLSRIYGISEERARWIQNPVDSFDPDLVKYIKGLRQTGLKIGIASNSAESSLREALQAADLSSSIVAIVSSSGIHVVKPNPAFWTELIRVTRAKAEEILFVDDRHENCQGAKVFGLQAMLYTGYDDFTKQIETAFGVSLNA